MSVNDKILDAIELLAKSSVERAGYDKTIQAQVIACQDKTIGKYKCKYQDAVFFAYVGNPDISLSNGSLVYILVPENDMSKDKTIIGTVEKLGTDYITIAEGEAAYEKVGVNSIEINAADSYSYPFYLDTINPNYSYDIYNETRISYNPVLVNQQELKSYVNKSSSLIIAATIQTKSPFNKSLQGINLDYGIIFTVSFSDGTTKDYKLDVSNMVGDPYKLIIPTRQAVIFPINGADFVKVTKISIYNNYDVTQELENDPLDDGDILISDLEIYGANRLSEQQLNGVMITLITPDGSVFFNADAASLEKRIIAQIKEKGQKISSQGISFYWGLEDMNITSSSPKFNKYLGYGWQLIEGVTGDQLILKKQNIRCSKNRYKVVAIYDGNLITRQIDIENQSDNIPTITIESDSGIEFFNNTGSPTLTCTTTNATPASHRWGWANNGGYFEQAADVIGIANINTLSYVQVSKIINYADFKCTVYTLNQQNQEQYLGTGSITLTNEQNDKANYLTIVNGQVIYKYTESGGAPTSQILQNPQLIKALTFIVRDGEGNTYNGTEENPNFQPLFTEPNYVLWRIPINNTLLKDNNNLSPINNTDSRYLAGYNSYLNSSTIHYELSQPFDYSKINNQIKLQVFYNGIYAGTQTQFMFTKQGDVGTNGTEYTVKIVPTTQARPQYPTVIKKGNLIYTNFNGDSAVQSIQFQAELWRSGQKIWAGAAQSGIITKIQWFILSNKYSGNLSDESDFSIGNTKGQFSFTDSLSSVGSNPTVQEIARANIIKCAITYENKIYYGTLPIITAYVNNSNNQISLKDNTGFIYAIYTTDGINPQYNRQPFEIIYTENNIQKTDYTYNFYAQGTTRIDSSNYRASNQLEQIEDTLESYQHKYRPISKYNGQCVTNSILCIVKNGNNIVGKIRIPVHLFLNRYGHANLNAWDGNSIQIDDNGHYILAPQIGAGVKDDENGFTGVVMGQVKEAGKSTSQIGLFGYASGARSFFLDSNTGSATFGRVGTGQITINATSATITGGNYSTSSSGSGMQINLGASPSIKYGNKNFEVDSSGNIKAGYQNSDWNFTVNNGNVTLIGNLKAGKKSYTPSGSSQSISYYNFEVNNSATGNNSLIQAGSTNGSDYNFIVEADGDVSLKGAITANSGKIGGINGWTIGYDNTVGSERGYIYSGNRTSLNSTVSGLYVGTDGISAYKTGTGITFKVDSSGNVVVNGDITLGPNSSISWGALPNDVVAQGDLSTVAFSGDYEDLDNQPDIPVLPSYIKSTYIDETTIKSPTIYAGKFYATGQGEYNQAAYYIYDGDPQYSGATKVGYISYDTSGTGTSQEARNRVIFKSQNSTPIKIKSAGDISIETNVDSTYGVNSGIIYMQSCSYFLNNMRLVALNPARDANGNIIRDGNYIPYPIGTYGSIDPISAYDTFTYNGTTYTVPSNPQIGQLYFKLIS